MDQQKKIIELLIQQVPSSGITCVRLLTYLLAGHQSLQAAPYWERRTRQARQAQAVLNQPTTYFIFQVVGLFS